MLKIALISETFGQSPYEYLYGSQMKLAIDNLCFELIHEAREEARRKAEARRAAKFG